MTPDTPGSLRVVISDDDLFLREGTRSILARSKNIEIVGVASDGEELSSLVKEHSPDSVVLHVRSPSERSETVESALMLRHEYPQMGVVVISQHPNPEQAIEILRNGANGFAYLVRDQLDDPSQLSEAIHRVSGGGLILDPTVVNAVLESQRRRERSRIRGLTMREHEVLSLMATGRNNAAIGRTLTLTEGAVEKHINSLFRKLGLGEETDINQRVAAVLFYLHDSNSK